MKAVRYAWRPGNGRRRDAHIDNVFTFWTGVLTVTSRYDAVVLGSGDYGLSGELAQAIAGRPSQRRKQVMTLSLPGSTSRSFRMASGRVSTRMAAFQQAACN